MSSSSVLVFGATGDIGSRLVRLLANHSAVTVTAAVRSLDKANSKLPANVRSIQVDTADQHSIRQAVADSRAESSFLYAQTASPPTLESLKAAGIHRIVLLSSCHVGLPGLPQGALLQLHKEPKDAIRALGVNYTFLRAERFSSNMLHFTQQVATTGKVSLAYPDAPYYVVAPADVATVAATALTTQQYDNKSVEITGPAVLSDRQQLATISTVVGKPIEVQEVSRAERAEQLNRHVPLPAVSESILDYRQWRQQHGPDVWAADELVRGSTTFEQWARENQDRFISG